MFAAFQAEAFSSSVVQFAPITAETERTPRLHRAEAGHPDSRNERPDIGQAHREQQFLLRFPEHCAKNDSLELVAL